MNTTFKLLVDELTANSKLTNSALNTTLENIFSFREIGNKTHGDLAEIGINSFVKTHLTGWKSKHVGKELYRAKQSEEDISVISPQGQELNVSIKAYGNGPLQLSTNKNSSMFDLLEEELDGSDTTSAQKISSILASTQFQQISQLNVLPLIYDEKHKQCRIMVFDWARACREVSKIESVHPAGKRKHPVYKFLNRDGDYLFEVRYGDEEANALQRGLWTNTKRAESYFFLVTTWINYNTNYELLELVEKIIVQTRDKHKQISATV